MQYIKNGNVGYLITSEGLKVRYIPENPQPEFPETIDIKITDKCNVGCSFCYEKSCPNGHHGNLYHPIFDSIPAGVELAIGGGDPMLHPNLENFLVRMKDRGVICNLTLHYLSFSKNYSLVNDYLNKGIIKGLGISLNNYDGYLTIKDKIIKIDKQNRICIHVIVGIIPSKLLKRIIPEYNILILGHKNRLDINPSKDTYAIQHILKNLKEHKRISFDNLAIEQLDVKSFVDEDFWNKNYMGDEGTFSMFIDLPNEKIASSSIEERTIIMNNDIRTSFNLVRTSYSGLY